MTRINLVEPHQLTDKHLMAEYRELPRIFTAVKKLVNEPKPRVGDGWRKFITSGEIPDRYVLGKGHMKFFYNKLPYLRERYREIAYVLRTKRNFNLDKEATISVLSEADKLIYETKLDMDFNWQPTPEDIYLNMVRLCKRSNILSVLEELNETLVPS